MSVLSGAGLPPRLIQVIEALDLLVFLAGSEGAKTVAAELRALTTDAVSAYEKLTEKQQEHAEVQKQLEATRGELRDKEATLTAGVADLASERAAWEGQKTEQQSALATARAEHEQAVSKLGVIAANVETQRQQNEMSAALLKELDTQLTARRAKLDARETEVKAREDYAAVEEARVKALAARVQAAVGL
jgi:chromosome segregation ATPase